VNTQRTILLIVLGLAGAITLGVVALVVAFGPAGAVACSAGFVLVGIAYHKLIGPRHRRWGATEAEAAGTLPGDELVPGAGGSTRAVTISAPPAEVFSWVAQIGFGRAGWYSYDWIDNDGRPSADHVDPGLERLEVGDVIAMTPTMGFTVRAIDRHRHRLVSQADDGTSWAVVVDELPDGRSRLVSRFRPRPAHGLGARAWMLLADPGAFVMERRMLLGIKARAEAPPLLSG
jgi:hypothetical protein